MNAKLAKNCALLAVGPVHAHWVRSPLDVREFEPAAKRAFRAARAKNPFLFDGEIFHLLAWHVERGRVRLEGCFVRFRHALASRALPRRALRIHPVGVSGLTILTHRGKKFVVLARRAPHVMTNEGMYECVPAGSIDAASKTASGVISLARTVRTELREELGIRGRAVTRITPFCLVQDLQYRLFDVGCVIEIRMSPDALQRAWQTTAREYTDVRVIPLARAQRWMAAHHAALVPTSAVLLDAYLQLQK